MAELEPRRQTERERPADAQTLRAMFWAGVLPRDALDAALRELGHRPRWRLHVDLLLLIVGGGLLLAGVVYFVAFNWMAMDRVVKLGGLLGLIVVCTGTAWSRGVDRFGGRALLFAACLLVGVFLAAFGQVYQTGADAWELFRAWGLLIALWVIASRAPAHWLLLLAVTDLAIALYFEQVYFQAWDRLTRSWLILAATQLAVLAGFEAGSRRGYFALPQTWPRWLLVPALLATLSVPTTLVIFDDRYDELLSWLVLLALAASIAGGYAFYRHVVRDLFALTCIGFCCAWVVMVLALRVLNVADTGCGGLLFVGLLVVGMLTCLVRWVRGLNLAMRREQDG